MNDDIFPSYFSTRNGSITEEEKRLFYVAITRAKKVVSVLADQEAFVQALTIKTIRKSGVLDKINNSLNC